MTRRILKEKIRFNCGKSEATIQGTKPGLSTILGEQISSCCGPERTGFGETTLRDRFTDEKAGELHQSSTGATSKSMAYNRGRSQHCRFTVSFHAGLFFKGFARWLVYNALGIPFSETGTSKSR
jgi:hypothetical protein